MKRYLYISYSEIITLVADKFFTNFRAEVRIAGDMSVNGENVETFFSRTYSMSWSRIFLLVFTATVFSAALIKADISRDGDNYLAVPLKNVAVALYSFNLQWLKLSYRDNFNDTANVRWRMKQFLLNTEMLFILWSLKIRRYKNFLNDKDRRIIFI